MWGVIFGDLILGALPVLLGLLLIGKVLWLELHKVSIFLKLSEDVARHGYVQHPVVIIPFEIDTTVQLFFSVFLYFVGHGKCL